MSNHLLWVILGMILTSIPVPFQWIGFVIMTYGTYQMMLHTRRKEHDIQIAFVVTSLMALSSMMGSFLAKDASQFLGSFRILYFLVLKACFMLCVLHHCLYLLGKDFIYYHMHHMHMRMISIGMVITCVAACLMPYLVFAKTVMFCAYAVSIVWWMVLIISMRKSMMIFQNA